MNDLNLKRKVIKKLFSPINSILLFFLLFLILSSILGILNSIACFFVSFFAIGFLLIIIVKRKCYTLDLFELIMDSIFISILVSMSIILALASLNLSIRETFPIIQLSIYVVLSIFIISKVNLKFKIRYRKIELLLFTLLILLFIGINVNFEKFYTPDEYVYLRNSFDFIQHNHLIAVSERPINEFVNALYGRAIWQTILSSFIVATSAQLPYYIVNLPFFVLLLTAVFNQLRLLFNENIKYIIPIWLIVCLNPLIFIFSHFVLVDFALASLSLFAVYWFTKAFKSYNNVDIYCLTKCLATLLVMLSMKSNLVLHATVWIVFVIYASKNRIWHLSKWHKFLFLIVTIPVIAYELFLDVPALFAYYVLHDMQLNRLFAQYVFFSPIGALINLMFKTPWTHKTWFDMPNYEKIFFFLNIISPELMTPLISSFALFSFLVLRKKYVSKILAGVSLIALLTTFIGALSLIDYYDIQRNALSVIILLQIVGLTSFLVSLNDRKHLIYASIVVMQVITYLAYIVLINKGVTSYLWGTELKNMFDRLLLMNILSSLLAFLAIIDDVRFCRSPKILKSKSNFTLRIIAPVLLFLLLFANNIDFTFYGLKNNTYFLDHGMKDLVLKVNNLEPGILIVSNAYALPLYTSNANITFISPPLNAEELNTFLKAGIKSKLIVNNDMIATWPSYKMGINNYLQALPLIIKVEEKNSNPPKPLFNENKKLLLHLSLINSSQIYTPLGGELNIDILGSPSWKYENKTKLLYLDGINDYIIVSGDPLLKPLQRFTVEVWFKTKEPQIGKFLVMGGYDNGTYLWGIYLSTNSTALSFNIRGQKIYNPVIKGNFNDGSWHQVVGVFDGKNITLYFDGKLSKNMMLKEPIIITPSEGFKIYIGSWSGRNSFEGYIGFANLYEDVFEPMDVIQQYIRAQDKNIRILAKVESITYNYTIFDIYGKNIRIPSILDVGVKDVDVRPVNVGGRFNYTNLSIDLYAKKSFNGTLILNTYYFSAFRHLEIKEGYNHIGYTFPDTIDSRPVGLAIRRRTEILIISDDGTLLANTVTALTILKEMELIYILVPVILIILLYIYLTYKENSHQPMTKVG